MSLSLALQVECVKQLASNQEFRCGGQDAIPPSAGRNRTQPGVPSGCGKQQREQELLGRVRCSHQGPQRSPSQCISRLHSCCPHLPAASSHSRSRRCSNEKQSKANPLHRSALCRGDVHLLQPQQHPAQRGEGRGGGWGAQPLAPLTKVLQTMPSTSPPPAAPLAGEPSICLQMGCFSHSSQTDSERNNDALLTKQFLCVKPSSLRFPPPLPGPQWVSFVWRPTFCCFFPVLKAPYFSTKGARGAAFICEARCDTDADHRCDRRL